MSSSWLFCLRPTKYTPLKLQKHTTKQGNPRGWKAMPFILGNDTFERLANMGLMGNFMIFLVSQFRMDHVRAFNIVYIWNGATNLATLAGAFISDAYAGRFLTIAVASFFSLLGMATLTLIPWIPSMHPPPCLPPHQCSEPTPSQLRFLFSSLTLLSIGSAGIRPCSLPFGVDQFDSSTDHGREGINSFYNWYYTSFTIVFIIAVTAVVYIQDSVSWVLGFGLPTIFMLCSIVMFFVGTKIYVYVNPEGSAFTGMARVIVAAYRKRHLEFAASGGLEQFYDPPLIGANVVSKLPLTNEYRGLNRAAIVVAGDLNPDGMPSNPWRLCAIQQIEELKCIARVIPIWVAGIISLAAITQQGTIIISQALKMNRHIGPEFQIPAGSIPVIIMLTVGLWVPFYDRIAIPHLRKITKIETGITLLQRIGIGIVLSNLSMVLAGIFEAKRRDSKTLVSVFWLAPQLVMTGFADAFNIIGQIEFYNRQFPEHLMSVGNALFYCTLAGANFLNSFLVSMVHRLTKNPDWLAEDIDVGRVDYFYYMVAILGFVNFGYFLVVASRYWYKTSGGAGEDSEEIEIELSPVKDMS